MLNHEQNGTAFAVPFVLLGQLTKGNSAMYNVHILAKLCDFPHYIILDKSRLPFGNSQISAHHIVKIKGIAVAQGAAAVVVSVEAACQEGRRSAS